jgi:hypothetical protein
VKGGSWELAAEARHRIVQARGGMSSRVGWPGVLTGAEQSKQL